MNNKFIMPDVAANAEAITAHNIELRKKAVAATRLLHSYAAAQIELLEGNSGISGKIKGIKAKIDKLPKSFGRFWFDAEDGARREQQLGHNVDIEKALRISFWQSRVAELEIMADMATNESVEIKEADKGNWVYSQLPDWLADKCQIFPDRIVVFNGHGAMPVHSGDVVLTTAGLQENLFEIVRVDGTTIDPHSGDRIFA